MSAHRGGRRRASRRQRIAAAVAGAALVVLGGLALLIVPPILVAHHASAASSELEDAIDAVQAGDVEAATEDVARAREHVDAAQDGVHGVSASVWRHTPVLDDSLPDAAHLVQALDDVTTVAEVGADLYPAVTGDDATLFRDKQVDRATLDRVIAGARQAGPLLRSAAAEIEQVHGDSAFFGKAIARERDQASVKVTPTLEALDQAEPMLDTLPTFLGFDGPRNYLVAIQNPSELRYSGGAALAFARMTWQDGKLDLQDATPLVAADPRLRVPITWPGVKGNPFHRPHTYLANSTFAPSWSIAGQELLRGWRSATGERFDGVVGVDVVAVAKVVEASGPIDVAGFGSLDGSQLTKTLIGSYDDFYPNPVSQDQALSGVVSAVLAQVFAGGNDLGKLQALQSAAAGRHLALYLQDKDAQAAFHGLGMTGDLAEPEGDYLGVFTQSLRASKVDFYQRRHMDLDVTLAYDGTASNHLDVEIDNDTPPYAVPGKDEHEGYFTRWSTLGGALFLPKTADIRTFSVGPKRWDRRVGIFYDHSYATQATVVPPDSSTHLRAFYRVPEAARREPDGRFIYRLAVDPQGTVLPASLSVTVTLPAGYGPTSLPAGWSVSGNTLKVDIGALEASQNWTISLAKVG